MSTETKPKIVTELWDAAEWIESHEAKVISVSVSRNGPSRIHLESLDELKRLFPGRFAQKLVKTDCCQYTLSSGGVAFTAIELDESRAEETVPL